MAKTKFKSEIILGETYTDRMTGFTGFAETITFFKNGCERVVLSKLSADGEKVIRVGFDSADAEGPKATTIYKTELVLGERYRDKYLDIEGVITDVSFYRNAEERAGIQRIASLTGGLQDTTHDASTLIRVKDEKPVQTRKAGGPARPTAGRVGA